jgi:hypothetical protein
MSKQKNLSQQLGHSNSVLVSGILGLMFLPGLGLAATHASSQEVAASRPLIVRVGQPSEQVMSTFKDAGMKDVRPHVLTDAERIKVQASLDSLPPLNKGALTKHLHQLAFVDGIPGEGTGLTSPAASKGQFDITLRASIIDESLSTFLTTKERRVFIDDGSGTTVMVSGTGTDALIYVLLHESTHVLDEACGITTAFPNSFDYTIWKSAHELTATMNSALATRTYFRGSARLPLERATDLYNSLSETPFVSLYATASAREDFAELVAWRELQQQHSTTLTISVKSPSSSTATEWHPLTFPALQTRFAQVDYLEHLRHGCPAGPMR